MMCLSVRSVLISETKRWSVLGRKVKIRIWDTSSGQERFKTLTGKFYRGSHGILMLYDMTNRGIVYECR